MYVCHYCERGFRTEKLFFIHLGRLHKISVSSREEFISFLAAEGNDHTTDEIVHSVEDVPTTSRKKETTRVSDSSNSNDTSDTSQKNNHIFFSESAEENGIHELSSKQNMCVVTNSDSSVANVCVPVLTSENIAHQPELNHESDFSALSASVHSSETLRNAEALVSSAPEHKIPVNGSETIEMQAEIKKKKKKETFRKINKKKIKFPVDLSEKNVPKRETELAKTSENLSFKALCEKKIEESKAPEENVDKDNTVKPLTKRRLYRKYRKVPHKQRKFNRHFEAIKTPLKENFSRYLEYLDDIISGDMTKEQLNELIATCSSKDVNHHYELCNNFMRSVFDDIECYKKWRAEQHTRLKKFKSRKRIYPPYNTSYSEDDNENIDLEYFPGLPGKNDCVPGIDTVYALAYANAFRYGFQALDSSIIQMLVYAVENYTKRLIFNIMLKRQQKSVLLFPDARSITSGACTTIRSPISMYELYTAVMNLQKLMPFKDVYQSSLQRIIVKLNALKF